MGSNDQLTRKEFLTLTFTLVGAAVAGGACSSDDNNVDGGFGGNFGRGGTFGTGGRGGTTGAGGTTGNGGTTGTAGTTGAGGNGAAACSDPLPEMQAPSDHVHTVTIHASMLNSTSPVTVDTSLTLAHMHSVTLQPAQLAMLKAGGSVTVTSTVSLAHTHEYTISCH